MPWPRPQCALLFVIVLSTPALADDDAFERRFVLGADGYVAAPVGGDAADGASFGVGAGGRGEWAFSQRLGLSAQVATVVFPGKPDSGYRRMVAVPFLFSFKLSLGKRQRWILHTGFGGAVNHTAVETVFGMDSETELAFSGAVSFGYQLGRVNVRAHYYRSGVFGAQPGGGIAIDQASTHLMISAGYDFTHL